MGLVYIGYRYNFFYIMTNDIDTKGRAHAKALQHLTTGVYISEVCLIGLFAIKTAVGPLVLMIIFLIATALFHAVMRNALKPLMEYVPDSYEGADILRLFSSAETGSYDMSKNASEPSVAQSAQGRKISSMKAGILARFFDPRKFKSHSDVTSELTNFGKPVTYLAEDEQAAYYDPAIWSPLPQLWIVRDPMGISRQEVKDSSEVIPITDEGAVFNEKNKVEWKQETVTQAPLWDQEKRHVKW